MNISQAIREIEGDLNALSARRLSLQTEPSIYLRNLTRTVEELERKIDKPPVGLVVIDPDEAWTTLQRHGFRLETLTHREIRTICTHVQWATSIEVLTALKVSAVPLANKFNLFGFATAYFHLGRDFEGADIAEGLIRASLVATRNKRRSRFLELWDERAFLFSANAAQRLAEIVVSRHQSVHQVCADHFIELTSALTSKVRIDAVKIATDKFCSESYDAEHALRELRWIVEDLMTPALAGESYRLGMSKWMLSSIAGSSERFRSALILQVQGDERLGDPRLNRNQGNWRSVAKEAQKRYLSWLAVETLQFFFDAIVPKNDENRRRADFWLKYAERPGLIKDFQVALSDEDVYRLRRSKQKMPDYARVTGGNTSAFLMVFEAYQKEYVIIEFSETGNAAYVYERTEFETRSINLRSTSFHLSYDLKRQYKARFRILHNTDWEYKASYHLAELGIIR